MKCWQGETSNWKGQPKITLENRLDVCCSEHTHTVSVAQAKNQACYH